MRTPIYYMVSWAYLSLPDVVFKRHLDRFSRFYTVHRQTDRLLYVQTWSAVVRIHAPNAIRAIISVTFQ